MTYLRTKLPDGRRLCDVCHCYSFRSVRLPNGLRHCGCKEPKIAAPSSLKIVTPQISPALLVKP